MEIHNLEINIQKMEMKLPVFLNLANIPFNIEAVPLKIKNSERFYQVQFPRRYP